MYILLTGSTGVGKSSIMKQISLQDGTIKTYSDPYVNNPFLSDAYTTERKACQSQMFFMKEFLKIHKDINSLYKTHNIIQERSIYECVHVFCRTFLKQGKMDKNEFEMLGDFLNILQSDIQLPDIIVYLTSSPAIIKKRIALRNRAFESSIDLSFIELQQYYYKEWLAVIQSKYGVPILPIENGNMSIEQTSVIVYNLFCNKK